MRGGSRGSPISFTTPPEHASSPTSHRVILTTTSPTLAATIVANASIFPAASHHRCRRDRPRRFRPLPRRHTRCRHHCRLPTPNRLAAIMLAATPCTCHLRHRQQRFRQRSCDCCRLSPSHNPHFHFSSLGLFRIAFALSSSCAFVCMRIHSLRCGWSSAQDVAAAYRLARTTPNNHLL